MNIYRGGAGVQILTYCLVADRGPSRSNKLFTAQTFANCVRPNEIACVRSGSGPRRAIALNESGSFQSLACWLTVKRWVELFASVCLLKYCRSRSHPRPERIEIGTLFPCLCSRTKAKRWFRMFFNSTSSLLAAICYSKRIRNPQLFSTFQAISIPGIPFTQTISQKFMFPPLGFYKSSSLDFSAYWFV